MYLFLDKEIVELFQLKFHQPFQRSTNHDDVPFQYRGALHRMFFLLQQHPLECDHQKLGPSQISARREPEKPPRRQRT